MIVYHNMKKMDQAWCFENLIEDADFYYKPKSKAYELVITSSGNRNNFWKDPEENTIQIERR